MPASMIRAPTGGRPKVIGSSIAMVATVPMPGRTPTRVPTSAPSRQNKMLYGWAATPKPIARFARSSDMNYATASESRPELERQVEQVDEQQDAEQRHHRGRNDAFDPTHFRRSEDRDDESQIGRRDQTQRPDHAGKGDNGHDDQDRPADLVFFDVRPFDKDTAERDGGAKACKDEGEQPRRGSRTKGETALAGQLGGGDQGQSRHQDEDNTTKEIPWTADRQQAHCDGNPDQKDRTCHAGRYFRGTRHIIRVQQQRD